MSERCKVPLFSTSFAGTTYIYQPFRTIYPIGTAMGVWISSRISGGRINLAVTLALATRRSLAWKKSSCELDVHPRFTLVVYFLHL